MRIQILKTFENAMIAVTFAEKDQHRFASKLMTSRSNPRKTGTGSHRAGHRA